MDMEKSPGYSGEDTLELTLKRVMFTSTHHDIP